MSAGGGGGGGLIIAIGTGNIAGPSSPGAAAELENMFYTLLGVPLSLLKPCK